MIPFKDKIQNISWWDVIRGEVADYILIHIENNVSSPVYHETSYPYGDVKFECKIENGY